MKRRQMKEEVAVCVCGHSKSDHNNLGACLFYLNLNWCPCSRYVSDRNKKTESETVRFSRKKPEAERKSFPPELAGTLRLLPLKTASPALNAKIKKEVNRAISEPKKKKSKVIVNQRLLPWPVLDKRAPRAKDGEEV